MSEKDKPENWRNRNQDDTQDDWRMVRRNNRHFKDKNYTSKKPPPPHQSHPRLNSLRDKPIQNKTINIPSGLLEESLEKITDYLINNLKELSKFDLNNEQIVSLLKMISKACDNDFIQSKSYMLKCVMEHTFIIRIRAFLTSVATIENPSKDAVLHVLTILENSMQLIPNTCKGFVEMVVKNMLLILPVLKGDWSCELDRVNTLKQDLERLESLFNKPKLKATVESDDPPPGPTPSRDIHYFDLEKFECEDFTTPERSFVRRNIVKGSYSSVKDYLDIHFRLLREDFLSPIREDLCDFLNHRNRHMFNIKVHKDVKFSETKYEKDKVLTVLQFKLSEKFLKLLESGQHKRFICGSLLIFSNDGFKTIFTGKVMGTRGLSKGVLDVEVYGHEDVFRGTFTMVECTVFYEPYFQVLSVIQKLEKIPMERYIVNVETNVSHPRYMESLISYSLPSFLNPSQRAAMHAALNKELVVIQGPPGTGKTFLGMELVKILLKIKRNVELEGPILIVTATNHALEQFLDGVKRYTEKIIRLGHGSEDMRSFGPEAEARNLMLKTMRMPDLVYDYVDEIDIFIKYLSVSEKNPRKNRLESAYRNLPLDLKEWLHERRILTDCYRSLKENEHVIEKLRDSSNLKSFLHLGIFESYDNIIILCWLMCNDGSVLPEKNFALDDDEQGIIELLYIVFHQLTDKQIGKTFIIESFRIIHRSIRPDVFQQLRAQFDFLYSKADFLEQCLNTDFGHTTENMENYNDIFEIPCRTRWQIYQRMTNTKRANIRHELLVKQERQRIDWEYYLNLREIDNVKLLKKMDIVAMTTTRAAKMRSTLELIGSPIVLVEEAAEVLESHIISALTTECQHLILLGDHQQLRPTTADYTIGQKFNLGISLFERLIINNIECHTLNVQHRMRPEISSLIHPLFYKELFNDRKVEEYPLVSGVKSPLYFIDHLEPEEAYGDSSKMNVHEAKFLIQLAIFLLNNNYEPEEITILAAYRGQMYEMKKQQSLCNNEKLQKVSIAVVDNFQGEENKIILLSLVRNNTEGSVGFLSTDNRVCVALSRAKHGLYIMGNMDLLCESSEIWKSIKSSLESQTAIGRYLPLKCKIHPEHETLVSKVTDFEKVPNGGCNQTCNTNLECGHKCNMICHAFDRDHKIYNCKKKCQLFLCENPNHLCRKLCFEPCGSCRYSVERTLTCGHKKIIACHKDVTKEKCMERKTVTPVCGHESSIYCHVDEATYKCGFLVQRELKCSHLNQMPCGQDLTKYECQQEENVTLKCGHIYLKKCHVNVNQVGCKEVVEKELSCKHKVKIECGQSVRVLEIVNLRHMRYNNGERHFKCMEPCQKNMTGCANPEEHGLCPLKCSDKCQPCLKIITKTYSNCSHSEKVMCQKSRSRSCQKICRKKRPCGHICYKKCSEDCGPCEQSIKKTAECGHIIETNCNQPAICHNRCDKILDCGHQCPKECGEPCEKICKIIVFLECGHKVVVNCDDEISPDMCEEYVWKTLSCGHAYKRLVPCNEQIECDEQVEHVLPCGHKQRSGCQEKNIVCTSKCLKEIPECGHPCQNLCKHPCTSQTNCTFPCDKKMECGHKCPNLCHQTCSESCKCQQYPALDCGHRSLAPCQEVCNKKLPCGHFCDNVCSDPCITTCEELCVKTLLCGHEYKVLCSTQVFKCIRKCQKELPCGHKSCRQLCGKPCDDCMEKCGKVLDCGHKCINLCRDPCACSIKKSPECDHYVRVQCGTVISRKNCSQMCDKLLECGHFCKQKCCNECICLESCRKRLKCGCLCIRPFCLEPCACRNGCYADSD